jgi:hypothetical protein
MVWNERPKLGVSEIMIAFLASLEDKSLAEAMNGYK